ANRWNLTRQPCRRSQPCPPFKHVGGRFQRKPADSAGFYCRYGWRQSSVRRKSRSSTGTDVVARIADLKPGRKVHLRASELSGRDSAAPERRRIRLDAGI